MAGLAADWLTESHVVACIAYTARDPQPKAAVILIFTGRAVPSGMIF